MVSPGLESHYPATETMAGSRREDLVSVGMRQLRTPPEPAVGGPPQQTPRGEDCRSGGIAATGTQGRGFCFLVAPPSCADAG